jgi:hypothetical protein
MKQLLNKVSSLPSQIVEGGYGVHDLNPLKDVLGELAGKVEELSKEMAKLPKEVEKLAKVSRR